MVSSHCFTTTSFLLFSFSFFSFFFFFSFFLFLFPFVLVFFFCLFPFLLFASCFFFLFVFFVSFFWHDFIHMNHLDVYVTREQGSGNRSILETQKLNAEPQLGLNRIFLLNAAGVWPATMNRKTRTTPKPAQSLVPAPPGDHSPAYLSPGGGPWDPSLSNIFWVEGEGSKLSGWGEGGHTKMRK